MTKRRFLLRWLQMFLFMVGLISAMLAALVGVGLLVSYFPIAGSIAVFVGAFAVGSFIAVYLESRP